jgi:hypothetical protein
MIVIQKIGKSFGGALRYHLKKLGYPDINKRAELLYSNFTSFNLAQIDKEVKLLRILRPKLNTYVFHASLSFPAEDRTKLPNDIMKAIALDYLTANGFTNNQYLIFRHHDTSNEHMHLLVNRISFDGKVVSDSNSYRRSESILRKLELKYGLKQESTSENASQRAATKDELEMVLNTGNPSHKMVLQELMKWFLARNDLTIAQLIVAGEKLGVYFLFNQASAGKVIGLCYFYNDFKIKGRSLGYPFKWNELIKNVDYEQDRDCKAISEANSRTKAKYGGQPGNKYRGPGLSPNYAPALSNDLDQSAIIGEIDREDSSGGKRPLETSQDAVLADIAATEHEYHYDPGFAVPKISDDIDKETKNRRRKEIARTNAR